MKKTLTLIFMAALTLFAACGKDPVPEPTDSISPYVVQQGSSVLYPDICGPWHCDSALRPPFFEGEVWDHTDLWDSDNIRLNTDFTALHNGHVGVWVIFDSFLTINTPENALQGNEYGYDFSVLACSRTRLVMQRRSEGAYITYWSRPK